MRPAVDAGDSGAWADTRKCPDTRKRPKELVLAPLPP